MDSLLIWLGGGLVAFVAAVVADYLGMEKDEPRCPSPEKIAINLVLVGLGPVGLIFVFLALIFVGGDYIVDRCSRNLKFMEWWENPICSWGRKKQ